jgi:hypothetical protein
LRPGFGNVCSNNNHLITNTQPIKDVNCGIFNDFHGHFVILSRFTGNVIDMPMFFVANVYNLALFEYLQTKDHLPLNLRIGFGWINHSNWP